MFYNEEQEKIVIKDNYEQSIKKELAFIRKKRRKLIKLARLGLPVKPFEHNSGAFSLALAAS